MSTFNIKDISEKFDISENGFLPQQPIKTLNSPFTEWENLVTNLPYLNKNKLTRDCVLKMEEFCWHDLKESWQIKRAYVVLTLLANSYVHSESVFPEKIPSVLSIPLWNVSKLLGISPILTHASVDLFNWDLINKNEPFELDNLKSQSLVTGTKDEEWFYLIMVAIEKVGGNIINTFLKILIDNSNTQLNLDDFRIYIEQIKKDLFTINTILLRMKDKCDPNVFYNQLRPYVNGWDKEGIIYEGISDQPLKYVGGSAAQSSLFQAIDCAFNINHKDDYFQKIKDYMPEKHKNFIDFVKENIKIYKLVNDFNDEHISNYFDDCIKLLEKFRILHYGLVHKYIIKMMPVSNESNIKGTGGTQLSSFLKEAINETKLLS